MWTDGLFDDIISNNQFNLDMLTRVYRTIQLIIQLYCTVVSSTYTYFVMRTISQWSFAYHPVLIFPASFFQWIGLRYWVVCVHVRVQLYLEFMLEISYFCVWFETDQFRMENEWLWDLLLKVARTIVGATPWTRW